MKSVEERRRSGAQTLPEGWEIVKLGDIVQRFIGGGTPSTSDQSYWDGGIAWMTSAHITGRTIEAGQRYISERGLNESSANLVPKGNLLISTRVGIGKVAVNLIDIAISQDLTGVLIKRDKADVNYLYWFLAGNSQTLRSVAQGSTIKGILKYGLANLSVPLPSLPEQRKIAEILGTVDEAIEKVDEAIPKTERLKRGMMQELLTKGIGHTSYRESGIGRIPSEWNIASLGELAEDVKRGPFGGSIKKETFVAKGYKVYEQRNVIKEDFGLGTYYIDAKKYSELRAFAIKEGDILVTAAGTIGKFAVVPEYFEPGIINQALIKVSLRKDRILVSYFCYLLDHGPLRNRVLGSSHGATMKNISSIKNLKSLAIPVPRLSEQEQISEVLNTIDKRLESIVARKKRLADLKRGLMEDLLTGKRRVKV